MKHVLLNFATMFYLVYQPATSRYFFSFQYRLMFFWKREMCPRQFVQIFGLFSFHNILSKYK